MAKILTILFAIVFSLQALGKNQPESEAVFYDFIYYLDKRIPSAFLDLNSRETVLFSDINGNVIELSNDPENEIFLSFSLFQRIDDRFQVIAWNAIGECSTILGFIPASTKLCFYIYKCHRFNGETRLFNTPDYDGSYRIIPDQTEARVVDVSDKWLKVEISEGNNISSGWVPFEEQCSEVYTTCS